MPHVYIHTYMYTYVHTSADFAHTTKHKARLLENVSLQ